MKAINRPFTEIINGNRQFIIPVFQRDFSWTREQPSLPTSLRHRPRLELL